MRCPHCGGNVPEQLPLWDFWDGPTREAIERVDRGADPEWKAAAQAALEHLARLKPVITPDDLWDVIERPREPRASGPVFLRARKAGLIEPTGVMVRSRNPKQHKNHIVEYRSLVWVGL